MDMKNQSARIDHLLVSLRKSVEDSEAKYLAALKNPTLPLDKMNFCRQHLFETRCLVEILEKYQKNYCK